ncbi:hypothetical protein PYW07_017498 [Mythimna separata]|uniref:Uncharacterized protein n=1 Tax=Mythimna separata TaxID=271217 RepID=A0AAD8DXI7_MYTSE|nr:hypothetical protein PYW07_017498 [Mythimna separata]
MWFKIVCVLVIVHGVLAKKDELLESLYGLRGRNRMAICVATPSGWRRCDAALYRRDWLVARARCLATAPAANLTLQLLAGGGSCDRVANGTWESMSTRQVFHVAMHPWFDLALAYCLTPYGYLDRHANATALRLSLKPHGVYRWMKRYFDISDLSRNHTHYAERVYHSQQARHHPLWYICVTMLLPSALFMVVFMYIMLYAGNAEPDKEKDKDYSKKVTHV